MLFIVITFLTTIIGPLIKKIPTPDSKLQKKIEKCYQEANSIPDPYIRQIHIREIDKLVRDYNNNMRKWRRGNYYY